MKIYAELHGDMQKPRIKSRGDNNTDHYTEMTKNLADAFKVVELPSLNLNTDQCFTGIIDSIGSAALDLGKVGDRPYRVNSVNISPRRY